MSNTSLHQATILKGVASQIIQMSIPTNKEVNALLEPFGFKLTPIVPDYSPVNTGTFTFYGINDATADILDELLNFIKHPNKQDEAYKIAAIFFRGMGFKLSGEFIPKSVYDRTNHTYTYSVSMKNN